MQLSEAQLNLIEAPLDSKLFLEGKAGTGKTTVGVWRMLQLLDSGIPAEEILVIVPQRELAAPYLQALRDEDLDPGGQVTVQTLGGLAKTMVTLFFPLIADAAGFADPQQQPTFLSLETAQYTMAHLVAPLIERETYFDTATIDRNRLYTQIIDNLNKAALVGFPYTEIGDRLKGAWLGDVAQSRMFDEAQSCASLFRDYCLQHNLLDFSLQVDVFMDHLWQRRESRDYLLNTYRHLIVDNVEEDTPATHRLLAGWLPTRDSALLIYDVEAGFRRFLGADPDSGLELRHLCDDSGRFDESFVTSPDLQALEDMVAVVMEAPDAVLNDSGGDPRAPLDFDDHRFYPQMLNGVAEEIAALVNDEGVSPNEIVVLAPFLSDALRFSLMERLGEVGIPARSHRPSRALSEEPATRCLVTLAQLAHPEWGQRPTPFDVAYALMQSIADLNPAQHMDLVRAQLLADAVYPDREAPSRLSPFEQLETTTQERVTYVLGGRYEGLRGWLEDYIAEQAAARKSRKKDTPPPLELDQFFSLIFGEVLSQYGFGFHQNFDAADVAGNLVDSARGFRRTLQGKDIIETGKPLGQEYVEMVQSGVIANRYYLRRGTPGQLEAEAVLVAPAYTFLMYNTPVDYQFWLDVGNDGWFKRLYQPLTHPFVLSQSWSRDVKWTDENDYDYQQETLYNLLVGLLRRCRVGVYLGLTELGESGYQSEGELLRVLQKLLRRLTSG